MLRFSSVVVKVVKVVEIIFNNNGFVFQFSEVSREFSPGSRLSLDNDRGTTEPATNPWPGGSEGENYEIEGKGELVF